MASRIKIKNNDEKIEVSYTIEPESSQWSVRYFGLNGSEIHYNSHKMNENKNFIIEESPADLVNEENSFAILLVNNTDGNMEAKVSFFFKQNGKELQYIIDGEAKDMWIKDDDELEPGHFLGGQFGTGDAFRFKAE